MKKIPNQRGLATLEVVMVAAIVAIFSALALPQLAQNLDRVQLDYEAKRFSSTANFARDIAKNSSYIHPSIFAGYNGQDGSITLNVRRTRDKNPNSYFIYRNSLGRTKYRWHVLPKNFKIEYSGSSAMDFDFETPGQASKTITFISPLGRKKNVISDSVGRFHVENVK